MKVTITGRHTTITPALRRYLDRRIQRLGRYGVKLESGQFVLSVEKYRHAAEGVVAADGRIIQGKVTTPEMYASIDRLMEKIERQLLKNKEKLVERKLRKRSASGRRDVAVAPSSLMPAAVVRVSAPVLMVEEALNQLGGHRGAWLVFRNAMTGHLQVVERMDGERIQLIDAGSSSSAE